MPTRSPATIVCACRADNTEAEIRELIRHGAGELFAGYVPRGWLEHWGMEVSPNRRYTLPDQIADRDQLRRIGQTAREHGTAFVIALNEHYYAPFADTLIDEIVATGLDAGASGFIVADLALLARLHAELEGRAELIVSQEAGIDSAASARLFVEHGAARLIFARETLLREMRQITGALADTGVAFEAFVLREFCINSSSRCFACHGHGFWGRFCVSPVRRVLIDRHGGADEELSLVPRGYSYDMGFQRAFQAFHRCGLCAIEDILGMGVSHLKVPGRSSYAIEALELLQRLFDSGDLSPQSCRQVLGSDSFCSGYQCYYALDSQPEPHGEDEPSNEHSPLSRRTHRDEVAESGAQVLQRAARTFAPRSESRPLELYLNTGTVAGDRVARLANEGLRSASHQHDGYLAPWEREVALTCLDTLAQQGFDIEAPPSRVQLGLELCALRLPGARVLTGEIERLQDAGFAVSLVLPVAYQAVWPRLLDVVDSAIQAGDSSFELVVNDLGLLHEATGRWPVRLATGRLFNRMKRDQFASDPSIMPASDGVMPKLGLAEDEAAERLTALRKAQQTVYGYPYLSSPFYSELLSSSRVSCVGMDILPTPLSAPLSSHFVHALYLPWTCVATTRACPVASAVDETPTSHPTESCTRPCRNKVLAYDYPWRSRRTVQTGAGIFMDCSDAAPVFLASATPAIERLVFEMTVPW